MSVDEDLQVEHCQMSQNGDRFVGQWGVLQAHCDDMRHLWMLLDLQPAQQMSRPGHHWLEVEVAECCQKSCQVARATLMHQAPSARHGQVEAEVQKLLKAKTMEVGA